MTESKDLNLDDTKSNTEDLNADFKAITEAGIELRTKATEAYINQTLKFILDAKKKREAGTDVNTAIAEMEQKIKSIQPF